MYFTTGRVLEGNDDEIEPKQRQTHIVWAIGVFFLFNFFMFFLKLTIVLLYIQVIIYIVHNWEGAGRQ